MTNGGLSRQALADVTERIEALAAVLEERQLATVMDCISAVLDRVILGRLVTDRSLELLRRYPNIYAGESSQRINARLVELGITGARKQDLVPKLKGMLSRGMPMKFNGPVVGEGTVRALLSRIAAAGVEYLRCASCGYHFRRCDMNSSRRKMIDDVGLRLSDAMRTERSGDPIKSSSFTQLEVDHIIPRVGLGPSDVSNLQVLCQLCNQGKMIFETGFESLSILAAAAYSFNFAMSYKPNRTIFYACLFVNGRRCNRCGRSSAQQELTIEPLEEWFTPWTVRVACYDCYGES
jgi:hypothetical protein